MTEMTPECQWCGKKLRSWDEPHDLMACLQEKLATAEARIEALDRPPCKWTEDADGIWNTTCGNAHMFIVGGPEDNDAKFCQYCGGSLAALAGE